MSPLNVTTGEGAASPPPPAQPTSAVSQPLPPANGSGVPGSLLASLRAAAAAQTAEHTEDFCVGGEFGKQLWLRVKPLDPGPMDNFINRRSRIREKQEADPRMNMPYTEMNMDLLAQSCVCVVGADVNGENREELSDSLGPVRLEHRLAVLLELPLPEEQKLNSHEVIMMIFGGNAFRIVDVGDDVFTWMRDPSKKPEMGNS
jgi:hypothetical protein